LKEEVMKTITTTFIFAVLVLGAGCGGSEDGTGVVQVSAAATQADAGSIVLSATRLELAVKEINIHVAAFDEEPSRPSGEVLEVLEDGGWVTIASERRMRLFPGENRVALGSTIVPAGWLTQIRLLLDSEPVLWNGSEQVQVACPSCSTSGLKLVIDDHAEVPADGVMELTMMFDLGMTASQNADGSKLGPVVHVELSEQP
jgi:hypothetical protein